MLPPLFTWRREFGAEVAGAARNREEVRKRLSDNRTAIDYQKRMKRFYDWLPPDCDHNR